MPQEAGTRKKPSVAHLWVFECIGYADVPYENITKLDDKSAKFIFIGYDVVWKG